MEVGETKLGGDVAASDEAGMWGDGEGEEAIVDGDDVKDDCGGLRAEDMIGLLDDGVAGDDVAGLWGDGEEDERRDGDGLRVGEGEGMVGDETGEDVVGLWGEADMADVDVGGDGVVGGNRVGLGFDKGETLLGTEVEGGDVAGLRGDGEAGERLVGEVAPRGDGVGLGVVGGEGLLGGDVARGAAGL